MSRPPVEACAEARERIIRAAERLFAREGYAAASIQELADEAGVNRALLYYYFGHKHGLYAAVLENGNQEFQRMMEAALATGGSYTDRLRAFIRGHLRLVCERGDVARVIHRCLLDGHEAEFGLVERFNGCMARMEAFFREGIEAGEFRPVDPSIAARTCFGPTFILSLWPESERSRFPRETLERELTAQILLGFRPSGEYGEPESTTAEPSRDPGAPGAGAP